MVVGLFHDVEPVGFDEDSDKPCVCLVITSPAPPMLVRMWKHAGFEFDYAVSYILKNLEVDDDIEWHMEALGGIWKTCPLRRRMKAL